MKRQMGNVLILGGRAPVALDHARRFAYQGWNVYIADSGPCRLSSWSNSVAGTITLSAPRTAPRNFIAELTRAVADHQIDLIIPTCEEVFFLSRYREELPGVVRIAVDEFEKLRMLHSKWHFQTLANKCGGDPPLSMAIKTIGEAKEWAGARPVVLKPEFSRFGVHVRVRPQGIPVDEPEFDMPGWWVVQDFRAGQELCSYSVADKGRLLAHCVYKPLHRIGRSASFYFVHREVPAIRQFVEKLVAKISFSGQISFDWIESSTGMPSVIECNPRATSGVHLFSREDSLPDALAGRGEVCVIPSSAEPRMLASVMLTAGLAQATRHGNIEQWFRDSAAALDVLAADGDRLPALGALMDLFSFGRFALRHGCTLREATTRDIEWDGEDLAVL